MRERERGRSVSPSGLWSESPECSESEVCIAVDERVPRDFLFFLELGLLSLSVLGGVLLVLLGLILLLEDEEGTFCCER